MFINSKTHIPLTKGVLPSSKTNSQIFRNFRIRAVTEPWGTLKKTSIFKKQIIWLTRLSNMPCEISKLTFNYHLFIYEASCILRQYERRVQKLINGSET